MGDQDISKKLISLKFSKFFSIEESKYLFNNNNNVKKEKLSILSTLYPSSAQNMLTSSFSQSKRQNQDELSNLINLVPRNIEPKEIRLNSSVDDLLKRFATESN